jgi:hypothetical protein
MRDLVVGFEEEPQPAVAAVGRRSRVLQRKKSPISGMLNPPGVCMRRRTHAHHGYSRALVEKSRRKDEDDDKVARVLTRLM